MKSICVLSSLYPNRLAPVSQVFVQQLVWALADLGVECTVICPVAVNLHPRLLRLPAKLTEVTDSGRLVTVYFPKFISFGQRNFFGLKTARLTTNLFYRAVHRLWKRMARQPEVIYGHFLTPAGICASRISRKYGVSSFAAYGESTPWSIENYGRSEIKKEINHLNGIVSVSTANQKNLQQLDVYPVSRVQVFPNGIRASRFYPHNKARSRKMFGFAPDSFIVAFLGAFNERKGVLRAAEAVDGLQGVQIAFAGRGPLQPQTDNCIFNGAVQPELVPDFLSAADVFILPTQNEGCCNAVIEAMSCGLPVISSNLPFNEDILSAEYAMLVDPNDIAAIRDAVTFLRDHPGIRAEMSRRAIQKARDLTIDERAKKILHWVQQMS
jgi:teichuronic acid biosynthesis glycosyltransferase TuaC